DIISEDSNSALQSRLGKLVESRKKINEKIKDLEDKLANTSNSSSNHVNPNPLLKSLPKTFSRDYSSEKNEQKNQSTLMNDGSNSFHNQQKSPLKFDSQQSQYPSKNFATNIQSQSKQSSNLLRTPATNSRTTSTISLNSTSSEFSVNQNDSRHSYPWSRDVQKALRQTFQLKEFRPNQLEAINATLNGNDTFILMPTGGGKSLCYQLPACVNTGKTTGLTFVISPLISLIQDQIDHLLRLGIGAIALSGNQSEAQKEWAYGELYNPNRLAKLVYVTPEMLQRSHKFQGLIKSLHSKKQLA
ncbi:ATP-dependent DNA helicase sgs1, partial [Nowakowskiella sp. JEL0078]